jgi:hypothetical protein
VTVLRSWAHLAQVSRLWRPREVMETWTFNTYEEEEKRKERWYNVISPHMTYWRLGTGTGDLVTW